MRTPVTADDASTTADGCDGDLDSADDLSDWETGPGDDAAHSAVDGVPPSVDPFPETKDPQSFAHRARHMPWPGKGRRPLSSELGNVIHNIATNPQQVFLGRRQALEFWLRRAKELQPERVALAKILPPRMRKTIGRLHLPLIWALATAAGFEDTDFVEALKFGFPLTGPLHAGGVGRHLDHPRLARGKKEGSRYVPSLFELREQCETLNRITLARPPPDDKVAWQVWEKSLQEVEDGRLGPLKDVASLPLGQILLVPRFGVWELRSKGWRVRVIDDYKFNQVNSAATLYETSFVDTLDDITGTIIELDRALGRESGGAARMREGPRVSLGLDDFVGAFKTISPAEDQRWLAWVLIWDPEEQCYKAAEMYGCPFGALGSVLAWHRVGLFWRTVMRRLFNIPMLLYVDDAQLVDAAVFGMQAQEIFKALTEATGWALDAEKRQPLGPTAVALGAKGVMGETGLSWTLDQDRADRWIGELDETLSHDRWSSETAGKWAGRFQWATSIIWGEVGRAYLRPLYWYREKGLSNGPLTARHRLCLQWWRHMLTLKQSRTIPWDCQEEMAAPDYVVFTDAEGNGGIGAIAYPTAHNKTDEKIIYTRGRVPRQWTRVLAGRKTQINAYEQAAVLVALGTFANTLAGKRVVFFIDSNAALGTIVKGHSRRGDFNLYAGTIWHILALNNITPYFLRVPSKKNPADAPSRGSVTALQKEGATLVQSVWPLAAQGLLDLTGGSCEPDFSQVASRC